jgi:hypothetical protein
VTQPTCRTFIGSIRSQDVGSPVRDGVHPHRSAT